MVVFHPLEKNHIREIARLQIDLLRQRLQAQHLELQISADALNYLSEIGYDPIYGARPLKRVMQQQVETPLAQALLAGRFQAGEQILMDW